MRARVDAFLGADLGSRTLYHGHSYGGNALAAAVALRHLELIEAWDVLANVRERSEQLGALLDDRIASKPAVRDVRLCGLMGGVELAPPRDGLRYGRRVSAAATSRGVLLRPLGDVVVLMPPLTVTSEEIHRIVDTLALAIDEVTAADDVERVGARDARDDPRRRAGGARRGISTRVGRRAGSRTAGSSSRSRRTTTSG